MFVLLYANLNFVLFADLFSLTFLCIIETLIITFYEFSQLIKPGTFHLFVFGVCVCVY